MVEGTLQAEIITIGTELLLGEIVDSNAAWISQQLTTIGLNLYYRTTVGDNLARITHVLREALARSEVVITTGGLGPTIDDMTREAVAAATDRELVLDEALVQEISSYFARRHYIMTDNNRKQACLPAGAQVIHNPVGTAPAFYVEHRGHVVVSLPGVPHEMRYLMENEVLPYLRTAFGLQGLIKSRFIHTCGIGESAVDSRIGDLMQLTNPTVGTRAHPGQTDVCITAKANTEAEADALIALVEAELRERLGDYVFGANDETLADVVNGLLASRGLRLGVVETTTCGELCERLSGAAASLQAFAGGTVLETAEAVQRTFGQAVDGLSAYDHPSQEEADACARAVRQLHGADLGLAVIGPWDPAAPDAAPVYYSLATGEAVIQGEPRQGRSGPAGRGWLIHLALDLVRRHLLGAPVRV